MSDTPNAASTPPAPLPGDSQMAGFGWSWAVLVGTTIVAFVLAAVLDDVLQLSNERSFLAGMLPPLSLLALLGIGWGTGRRNFARGVLAGLGSMFALLLLGIAACFGLVGLGGF